MHNALFNAEFCIPLSILLFLTTSRLRRTPPKHCSGGELRHARGELCIINYAL